MKAQEVWDRSDGELTTRFYQELTAMGSIGLIAVNLFRAQRSSGWAKTRYKRTQYKSKAYDKKNWSLQNLCTVLSEAQHNIVWGWKQDPLTPGYEWVLYIDLPQGQVSFHSAVRYAGPDYPKDWDRSHLSAERIIAFCDAVYSLKGSDSGNQKQSCQEEGLREGQEQHELREAETQSQERNREQAASASAASPWNGRCGD